MNICQTLQKRALEEMTAGEYATAAEQWKRLAAIQHYAWGPLHPETLWPLQQAATCYRLLDQTDQALRLYLVVYRRSETESGKQLADTYTDQQMKTRLQTETLFGLFRIYVQRKHEHLEKTNVLSGKAFRRLERALDEVTERLYPLMILRPGPAERTTRGVMDEYANLLFRRGELADAINVREQLGDALERHEGIYAAETLHSLSLLSRWHSKHRAHMRAIRLAKSLCRRIRQKFGPQSTKLFHPMVLMSRVYGNAGMKREEVRTMADIIRSACFRVPKHEAVLQMIKELYQLEYNSYMELVNIRNRLLTLQAEHAAEPGICQQLDLRLAKVNGQLSWAHGMHVYSIGELLE